VAALVQTLFTFDFYKRTQGKLVRQVTFGALAIIIAWGCWRLKESMIDEPNKALQFGIPLSLLALGIWAAFRLVHYPPFADFLISVEVEMNKVSWPRRGELYRASIVVMLVIFVMAGLLYGYDLALRGVPWLWSRIAETVAGWLS
jgi:preprotein translocase subunit SecE